jgi:hypothetical protein
VEPGLNRNRKAIPAPQVFRAARSNTPPTGDRATGQAAARSTARRRCPRTMDDTLTTDPEPARIAGKQEAT